MIVYMTVLVGLLPSSSLAGTVPAADITSIIQAYDRTVETTLKEAEAPGAVVVIVKDDRVVYMKCYGVRHIGRPDEINPHTIFRIASVSKGFASVLAGLLAEEQGLAWDDPVIKHLPAFELADSLTTHILTIRHILSHTTGLPRYAFDNLLDRGVPFDIIKEEMKKLTAMHGVGSYTYQNAVYSLIGEIIESVSGRSYQHLLHDRLLKPLGMYDASMGGETLINSGNQAWPHVRWKNRWRTTRINTGYDAVLPAAGVNASISDMGQWLRAMLGGMPHIVSPSLIQQLSTPVAKSWRERRRYNWSGWHGRVRTVHYGMGWRIFNYAGTRMVFHSGGLRGYRSQIAFIPEYNVGIAMMSNSQRDYGLVPSFLDLFLGLSR